MATLRKQECESWIKLEHTCWGQNVNKKNIYAYIISGGENQNNVFLQFKEQSSQSERKCRGLHETLFCEIGRRGFSAVCWECKSQKNATKKVANVYQQVQVKQITFIISLLCLYVFKMYYFLKLCIPIIIEIWLFYIQIFK